MLNIFYVEMIQLLPHYGIAKEIIPPGEDHNMSSYSVRRSDSGNKKNTMYMHIICPR